jgi:hypothetical protein
MDPRFLFISDHYTRGGQIFGWEATSPALIGFMGHTSLPIQNCVCTVYIVLIGKSLGKRSRGRRRNRWNDNIINDLKVIRYEDLDWIYLAQDKD